MGMACIKIANFSIARLQIERSELDQILERRIEQSLRAVLAIAFLSVRLSVRHIVSNE